MVPEHVQCVRIGRHCVVIEVAADDNLHISPSTSFLEQHGDNDRHGREQGSAC